MKVFVDIPECTSMDITMTGLDSSGNIAWQATQTANSESFSTFYFPSAPVQVLTITKPNPTVYRVFIDDVDYAVVQNYKSPTPTPSTTPPPATNPLDKANGAACDVCGGCQAGEPITIGTGNVYEPVTDYQSAGENALMFARFYNSMGEPTSLAATLGARWRSTFDRYLRISPSLDQATTATAERADGQLLSFSLQGSVWTSDSDVDLNLTQNGTTWTLTDRDDTVETYTMVGTGKALLSSIEARDGYTQTLSYTSNVLTSVTDSYGRKLAFAYQSGLLQTVTTPGGLVLTYSYDSSGVTAGVLDRLTGVAYSTKPVTQQTYLYEDAAFPFALTGIVDENGNRFATWSYDGSGRGTLSQHAGGADLTTVAYNDTDGSRTVTNALGQQEVYQFATLQGVPKVTEIDRQTTATTAAAVRSFTYDANGYTASSTDWNGNLTTYVNDSHGQPTSITEASGTNQARTTGITYHPTFHLPAQITAPELTMVFGYDGNGNLQTRTASDTSGVGTPTSRTWTYTYNGTGEVLTADGPRTNVTDVTSYGYDAAGNLITVTNALGQVTKITKHDKDGRPQNVRDPNGLVTALAYDPRGWLTSRKVGTEHTGYAYDAAGNLITLTLPDKSTLTYGYDTAHRLTSVTDVLGNNITYTLDAAGNRTREDVYDPSHTLNRTRSHAYDALSRLSQDIGAQLQTTQYGYDGNGNLTSLADPLTHTT